jgi:Undecaprenyl-phosphate galactose phosphotransferase WbaP
MAFVVPDNEWSAECGDFFKNYLQGFYRIILLPNMMGLSSLWVATVDISGFLGLEIKQKLLDPKRKALKRGTDLLLAFCLSPFAFPLLFILAAAVRLDSPGPVFFRQTRLGLGGRSIRIWKFRTMVRDADEQLERYLAERPDLRREWEQGQKIQKDPRVTRVGRFLRKTSLDELPQLWNVLKGDMSLVGPRPIIESEIARYRQTYALYTQVRPGVTGLWQVSGRNTLEYEQRVHLDAYYVRNWSLWLDIFILARTPMEVFRGRGAV